MSPTFASLLVMRNVDIEVEAVLGLVEQPGLDTPEVVQPPPGHGLQGGGGVGHVREGLGTHGAVRGGGEHTGPVGGGAGGGQPAMSILRSNTV